MKLSDKETQAIIQIANQKLIESNPDYEPASFDQIYRIWAREGFEGWVVSLQDHDGNIGGIPGIDILNSEIEAAIKLSEEFEYYKQRNSTVSKAMDTMPGSDGLKLAIVELVKELYHQENLVMILEAGLAVIEDNLPRRVTLVDPPE